MGQQFIENEAGSDGTFTPDEVEGLLFNNRSYLAENILPSLLSLCAAQGSTPVDVDGTSVDVSQACAALGTLQVLVHTCLESLHSSLTKRHSGKRRFH